MLTASSATPLNAEDTWLTHTWSADTTIDVKPYDMFMVRHITGSSNYSILLGEKVRSTVDLQKYAVIQLYRTLDSGKTIDLLTEKSWLDSGRVTKVASSDSLHIYLQMLLGAERSTDGGKTWLHCNDTCTPFSDFVDFRSEVGLRNYNPQVRNRYAFSRNYGQDWQEVNYPDSITSITKAYNYVRFLDSEHVFLWQQDIISGTNSHLRFFKSAIDGSGLATVGCSIDGVQYNSHPCARVFDVVFNNAGVGLMIAGFCDSVSGAYSACLRSQDRGNSWTTVFREPYDPDLNIPHKIYQVRGDTVAVLCEKGTLLWSNDYGNSWFWKVRKVPTYTRDSDTVKVSQVLDAYFYNASCGFVTFDNRIDKRCNVMRLQPGGGATSVKDIKDESCTTQVISYPQPCETITHIRIPIGLLRPDMYQELRVVNCLGQTVAVTQIEKSCLPLSEAGFYLTQFDLSSRATGMYHVVLHSGDRTEVLCTVLKI